MTAATPARPSAGRHAVSPAVHVFEHRWLSYKRTFRASVFSSFLSPVLFLTAMGLGLGTYVDAGNPSSLGGVTYIQFLAPGLLAATAMQSAAFESTFPIMSGILWSKVFHAMAATPISVRDIARRQPRLDRGAAHDDLDGLHARHHRVRGRRRADDRPRHPGRGPDRHGVRDADRGLRHDPVHAEQVQRDLPVRDPAAVPVLGHVLPDLEPAPAAPGRGLADAAVPRRRADAGRCRSGPWRTTRSRRSSTSPTSRSCSRSAYVALIRLLDKRMVPK